MDLTRGDGPPLTLEMLREAMDSLPDVEPYQRGVLIGSAFDYKRLLEMPLEEYHGLRDMVLELKIDTSRFDQALRGDWLLDSGRCPETCGKSSACSVRCTVSEEDHEKPRVGRFHIFPVHDCQEGVR